MEPVREAAADHLVVHDRVYLAVTKDAVAVRG